MKIYIYILTDCKRSTLKVGYSTDLASTVELYKEKRALLFNTASIPTRLVYTESCYSEEEAKRRVSEMHAYTRQQKERLIRCFNPNWSELRQQSSFSYHPGAKFNPNVPNLTSFL